MKDSRVLKGIGECSASVIEHSKTYFQPLNMFSVLIGPWKQLAIDYFGPSPFVIHLFVVTNEYSLFFNCDHRFQ
jgi:hypothetical protein